MTPELQALYTYTTRYVGHDGKPRVIMHQSQYNDLMARIEMLEAIVEALGAVSRCYTERDLAVAEARLAEAMKGRV